MSYSVSVAFALVALFGLVYGAAVPEALGTEGAAVELAEGPPRPGMSLHKVGGGVPYLPTARVTPRFFYRPRMLGELRPVEVGPAPATRPESLGGLKGTRGRQYSQPYYAYTDPAVYNSPSAYYTDPAAAQYNSPYYSSMGSYYYYPYSSSEGYSGLTNGYPGYQQQQYNSYTLPYYYGTTVGYGYGYPQVSSAPQVVL